jgi:glyoxylase-like metal-dependent hydrolase (beta-lactamase superfamily II)
MEPHRLELPTPFRIGTVNVYLLEGSPLTLVDAGPRWAPAMQALEAGLESHGRSVEDLELVLLTHQHCDHVGLANAIRRRSGAEVAAIEPLAVYVEDYAEAVVAEDGFAVDVMERYGIPRERIDAIYAISSAYWSYGEPVTVDRRLADGELVVAGDRSLRVERRPGHSPTDTLFIDEVDQVAFSGDHLMGRVSSNPVVHRPLSGAGAADRDHTLAQYLDSLRRTAALDLRTIHPGHGDVHHASRELAQSRLEHHRLRKEHIAELVSGGRNTVTALSDTIWGALDDTQTYLAVSEVLGHVDLLVEEGRVVEQTAADGVIFEPR